MWRRGLALAAVGSGALWMSGCATMSEDQCLAGDWGGQGYRDGVAGQSLSRLDDHARACAKHGVTPQEAPYRSAREDGLRLYCTRERGFEEGRKGASYQNVCAPAQEADFLPAYADGRVVHAAYSELDSAESAVSGYGSRLEELDDKIDAKQRECRDDDLSEAERERACARIGELRDEKDDTRRSWRDAQDRLRWAEREVELVRSRFAGRYGWW